MRFNYLQDWLAWQETLHSQKIELGLDRIAEVAKTVGIKQPKYFTIIVAGTNGKGSIVSILESIFHHAGYRVGAYTSPHLLKYNERIRINKKNIDDYSLCKAFDLVDQSRGDTSLSYFEFGTLAAMQIFNNIELDVAIYEVGLGGRLDAVNILDADLSIVSNIGIDHVQWLGTTRESIGFEKAGIFRSHSPAICGDKEPPDSLIAYAKDIDTKLYLIDQDFSFSTLGNESWSFNSSKWSWESLPIPNLYGDAQISNAATALMALLVVDEKLPVTRDSINKGLCEIKLQGRFQLIDGPCDVVLDVAHNLDSVNVLVKNLKKLKPVTKTCAIFAVLADKDVHGIIDSVKDHIDEWYISQISFDRALSSDDLKLEIQRHSPDTIVHSFPSVSEAYKVAKQNANDSMRIVVFGSFLTVAEVLDLEV